MYYFALLTNSANSLTLAFTSITVFPGTTSATLSHRVAGFCLKRDAGKVTSAFSNADCCSEVQREELPAGLFFESSPANVGVFSLISILATDA